MSENEFFGKAAGKNVLFITTKNIDYIRNSQETRVLKSTAKSLKVLGYGGNYGVRLLRIYLALLFMPLRQYDLVFVGFAPQLVVPFFHWRFRHKLVLIDFFISFYDTLVNDRKRISPSGAAAKALMKLDSKTIEHCDWMIADTQADAEYFAATFAANPERICVYYLQADTDIFYPRSRAEHTGFVVLYFGSILPLQGVETVFECARRMQPYADITFEIIGPVPKKILEDYDSLSNLRLTRWLPQEQLADRIACADLCLAGHFNCEIGKAARTIPGKAYIYHAMARPMILGENPANREYFEEDENLCYFVTMGDPEALKEKILHIKEKSDHLEPNSNIL